MMIGGVEMRHPAEVRPAPGFIVPGVVVELAAQGMARAFVDGLAELSELAPLERRAAVGRVGGIMRAAIAAQYPEAEEALDFVAALLGGIVRSAR